MVCCDEKTDEEDVKLVCGGWLVVSGWSWVVSGKLLVVCGKSWVVKINKLS
jgi:hypothetical protein